MEKEKKDYKNQYLQWVNSSYFDDDTKNELKDIKDEKEKEDRFYRDLEFGTGGLRGVMAAGTNRMNVYTISKATKGLASYLNSKYDTNASVAIAYDSRNNSKLFAERAAAVLCASKVKVFLFESLRPTPMLSFTVRHKKCSAGIVITASHNSKQYNGYKVYGQDGGQITDEAASKVLSCISEIEDYSKIDTMELNVALNKGLLNYIGEDVDCEYYNKVKSLIIRKDLIEDEAKNLNIIYTPIHGSGNVPVRRVLKELGFTNVAVVKEQEKPDGNFPTASYPNPENPSVFKLALEMAKTINPDIIFGTDPDCDRIGVVVKDRTGEYRVLTGNQTGSLLTYYVLNSMLEKGRLNKKSTIIKTIVTSDLGEKIAESLDVKTINVLTGFKYIGEKIKEFEKNSDGEFLLGFEESYGYLLGTFVRDKDAVIASAIICEMALYFKSRGLSLYDALQEIYEKYGYYKEDLISMELNGIDGQNKIKQIMDNLRNNPPKEISSVLVSGIYDYKIRTYKDLESNKEEEINLPKSNVLKFILKDGSWLVVRPSGTEPKIKIYFSVNDKSDEKASSKLSILKNSVMAIIEKI